MKQIVAKQKNINSSLLGRKTLERRAQEILRIFDAAKDGSVSRTYNCGRCLAEKLDCSCNRKFAKKVLDEKRRKSRLEKKLRKIS